jgi:membrane associated rhomboid family serine protease
MPDTSKSNTGEESSQVLFTGTLKRVMELSLVLASQRIPHMIVYQGSEYGLEVNESDRERAGSMISLYIKENRDWKIHLEHIDDIRISLFPLLLLAVPTLLFFFQFSTIYNPTWLTYAGRCNADKILSGEWWLVFTGLTLHADIQHYLSNMLAGYFILLLLVNRINTGLAMLLVSLLAGAANYLTAMHSSPGHLSLGFSTAVFAALGFLSGIQARQNYLQKVRSHKPWGPIVAAFFIVTLIGLGEGADIRAHIYGFVAGILGGLGGAGLDKWTGKWWIQMVFILLTYGIFALCWKMALSY